MKNLKFFKEFLLLIIFSLVFLDLSGNISFGFDKLFYKVDFIFADLITIIPSIEELKTMDFNSKNKLSSTETMGRPMNYPLIWVYIFDFVGRFINPVLFFGYSQILFFFLYVYYLQSKIFNYETLIVLLIILFSPPILLLLERGNNDLIIFFLITISISSSSFLRGFLLGLATALKVYPIILFIVYFLFKKVNKNFIFGVLITLPLIIYTFLHLKIYIGNTAMSFSANFGLFSMGLFFQKIIDLIFNLNMSQNFTVMLSIISFFLTIITFYFLLNKEISNLLHIISLNKKSFEIFIISMSLSFFIFIIFSSWAYRLIFLIPACVIFIDHTELKNHFFNLKKSIIFILVTLPFLSTWFLIPTKEILLNHYTWAFFAPLTFCSFSLYFIMLIKSLSILRKL